MQIQNRHLFRLTRFVLLTLPKLLRFIARFRKPAKRLLIIKTDAIGDYILFRNFIEITKRSQKYSNYQIDLLGNNLWRDVTLTYDEAFLNKSIFISPDSFYESPLKTLKLGWRLFLNNYEVVLQPTYTRVFITDGLAALTAAKHIIGFESDNEGIVPRYKNKTDKFYTQKLLLPQGVYFEFDRTRYFFEQVLNTPVDLAGPSFPAKDNLKQGVTLFLGAGNQKRGWQTENYLELMALIMDQTQQPVLLVGGPEMEETAAYFEGLMPEGRIINLVGKTTLPKLIDHIARTALVICNETSAVHIAAACNTKAVCILGGGHFDRFAPYPQHVHHRTTFVYEKMPCYYCNWLCIYKTEDDQPFPCISAVTIDNVWQAVSPLLPA